jgi:hypothetical protein
MDLYTVIKALLRFRGLALAGKESEELSNWFLEALPGNILEMGREAAVKSFEETAMESLIVLGLWLDVLFVGNTASNSAGASSQEEVGIHLGSVSSKIRIDVGLGEDDIIFQNAPSEMVSISFTDFEEVCSEKGLQNTLIMLIHAITTGEAIKKFKGVLLQAKLSKRFKMHNPRVVSLSNLAGGGSSISQTPSEAGATSYSHAISQAQVVLEQKVLEKANLETFKEWKIAMQSFRARGGVADPVLCIVPKASTFLEVLWSSDPELQAKCSWSASSSTLGWDLWFKEVQEMLRKAEGKPRLSKANLDLKYGHDSSLQAFEWLTVYREFVDDHDVEVDANKAVESMLKHVEKACPGFAARQREAVPEWKLQAAAEGQPFSVSFALKKLTRPLLLQAQVFAEARKERVSESDEDSDKKGGAHPGERDKKRRLTWKKDERSKDELGQITCYKCGKAGHKANSCKSPPKDAGDGKDGGPKKPKFGSK